MARTTWPNLLLGFESNFESEFLNLALPWRRFHVRFPLLVDQYPHDHRYANPLTYSPHVVIGLYMFTGFIRHEQVVEQMILKDLPSLMHLARYQWCRRQPLVVAKIVCR